MVVALAGGPNWTDILTAVGTVGAVIVAVGIALWTERRSERRIKAERDRSDRALAEQQAQAKAAIEDERAYGRAQLEEERRIAREREQLIQAYAVQVVHGQRVRTNTLHNQHGGRKLADNWVLSVFIVNRGAYAITRVEAQFCLGDRMIPYHGTKRISGFDNVSVNLRSAYQPSAERSLQDVLTPFDEGIAFETEEIGGWLIDAPYPVVRWIDHWSTRWEHKRGVVRQVRDDEQGEP